MFQFLQKVTEKPKTPFCEYTAPQLWNDNGKKMLEYHLNPDVDISSRKHETIEKSVKFILQRFPLDKKSRICDLGCGPGLYCSKFSEHVDFACGVDFSTSSIDYAKKEAITNGRKNIEYINKNYLDDDLNLKNFDLATLIFCDYCALSCDQREKLLKNVRKILKPGGWVMLDVFSKEWYKQTKESTSFGKNFMDGFWSEKEYYCFKSSFKYDQSSTYLDRYCIVTEERTWEIFNWLKCFDLEELKEEMERNGFIVEDQYSDVTGALYTESSKEFCVIARSKNDLK